MKFTLFTTAITSLLASCVLAFPNPEVAELDARKEADKIAPIDEKSIKSIQYLFEEIENIPDAVLLKGDKAVAKWLKEHAIRDPEEIVVVALEDRDLSERAIEERGLIPKKLKCAWAISSLLLNNAIPASRILKIKKYLKEAGGIAKAVKIFLKTRSKAKLISLGGKSLWNLYKEISGINDIKKNCF